MIQTYLEFVFSKQSKFNISIHNLSWNTRGCKIRRYSAWSVSTAGSLRILLPTTLVNPSNGQVSAKRRVWRSISRYLCISIVTKLMLVACRASGITASRGKNIYLMLDNHPLFFERKIRSIYWFSPRTHIAWCKTYFTKIMPILSSMIRKICVSKEIVSSFKDKNI